MKKISMAVILTVLLLTVSMVTLQAGDKDVFTRTFKGKEIVRFTSVSGSCIVKKSASNEIVIERRNVETGTFTKPRITEDGNELVIKDSAFGGDAHWTIAVPVKTQVRVSLVSGNLVVEGVEGEVTAKTVSGNVEAKTVRVISLLRT